MHLGNRLFASVVTGMLTRTFGGVVAESRRNFAIFERVRQLAVQIRNIFRIVDPLQASFGCAFSAEALILVKWAVIECESELVFAKAR